MLSISMITIIKNILLMILLMYLQIIQIIQLTMYLYKIKVLHLQVQVVIIHFTNIEVFHMKEMLIRNLSLLQFTLCHWKKKIKFS